MGSSGSGKSTLARQLGEITNIPAFYMDGLRFTSNRAEIPKDEFRAKQTEIVAKESWIFEGNSLGTMAQRMDRADTVVFIDYNRFFCIYRVIKRRVQIKKKPRLEMPYDWTDKVEWEFIKWIWNYPKRTRPKIIEAMHIAEVQFFHLKTRKQVREFVEMMREMHP